MNEETRIKQLHVKHKKFRERLSMFAKIDKARLNTEMIQIASQSFSVGNTKADAEYEMDMAHTNKKLNHKIDTFFIPTDPDLKYVSSSLVREIMMLGKEEAAAFVPKNVAEAIKDK